MINGSKNKKILLHFNPVVWVMSNGVEDTPLRQFLLSSLYSFDFIFSGIVWIDKLNNIVKGICFNVKETGKKLFRVMVAKKKKMLHQ